MSKKQKLFLAGLFAVATAISAVIFSVKGMKEDYIAVSPGFEEFAQSSQWREISSEAEQMAQEDDFSFSIPQEEDVFSLADIPQYSGLPYVYVNGNVGENANECNLITGTRYLNTEGMWPVEETVLNYVRENPDNHVLYRITPVFEGDNLLASGVLMEAYSVEDSGSGVQFCVYCYNVQPDVTIDYATGESFKEDN